jgi:hypothetical protein
VRHSGERIKNIAALSHLRQLGFVGMLDVVEDKELDLSFCNFGGNE